MGDLLRAFVNEFRVVYRTKLMLLITIIILPIASMLILGYIFPQITSIQNYKIAVYNADSGPYSKIILSLVYSMLKGQTFESIKSEEEVNKGLESGKFDGAIVIPSDFSKEVESSNRFKLIFMPSTANIQTSVVIYQTLNAILSEIGNGVMIYNILDLYKKPSNRIPIAPPKMEFEGPSSNKMKYVDFMIPGLAALIAIASIAITLSSSVSYEREHGIFDGILVSSVNRSMHSLGKILAHTADGTMKGMIALIAAQFFFASGFGTPFRAAFILALGSFAFSGIGMIISTLSPSQKLSNVIAIGYILPSIFLSGLFIPIQQMPKIAQRISEFFPLTFMSDGMQRMNILNNTIPDIFMRDIMPLLIYVAVFVPLALFLFAKVERLEEAI